MSGYSVGTIASGEPVRYGMDRWSHNNGFRRRWLQRGYRIVRDARRGEITVMCRFSDGTEFPAWTVRHKKALPSSAARVVANFATWAARNGVAS